MKTSFLLPIWTFLVTHSFALYILDTDFFTLDANGSFFDKFDFWNTTDPTHGTVSYRNYSDCVDLGLIQNTTDNIIMRADSTLVLKGDDGRPSVRIESKKKFYRGLIVVDVDHMPGSICGVWPAFWTYGPHWPRNGEIDIIEGINQFQANRMTLHTAPGCNIKNQSASSQHFSGSVLYTNCTGGNGCSIGSLDTTTYGDGFNANGGGIYAAEWTDAYIAIYFFPREACAQSDPVTGPLGINPDPSTWGIPLSRFDLTCDIENNFRDHSIVFDITFCGDWADGKNQWNSTIPINTTWPPFASSSGQWDWVKSSPEAFKDAYWSVSALRVYQETDGLTSYQGGSSSFLEVEVDVDLSSGNGQNQQRQGQNPPNLMEKDEENEIPRHGHLEHHKHKHRR
ncbi:glycoside hydrolase family 16 protein [Cercospora zeae-maydis SCOH1-5]|uniref:Glycoside hydrolase family 16 protein n=1 Tax=Cercospora zeae-maydis SCOH1-5 TaxID=717836 RepID=A0A6A6FEH2_9PEZI|nr:glycoside hydrolase family 16 protein [Cercospora zeae-maydis SCOH1-5]